MGKGIFITFEGTEGAGKSTLIHALATKLRRLGRRVRLTREPGGTPLSEKIRALILNDKMNPWTELFLYEAARAEHVARALGPALTRGDVVLCDRFTDSSLAYQGFARKLPWKDVQQLNRWATQGLKPHLTVFLDIDPATGLKHAQVQTRFEKEGVLFQSQVRKGFLKARRERTCPWITLQGRSQNPEKMAERLLQILVKRRLIRRISTQRKKRHV